VIRVLLAPLPPGSVYPSFQDAGSALKLRLWIVESLRSSLSRPFADG